MNRPWRKYPLQASLLASRNGVPLLFPGGEHPPDDQQRYYGASWAICHDRCIPEAHAVIAPLILNVIAC